MAKRKKKQKNLESFLQTYAMGTGLKGTGNIASQLLGTLTSGAVSNMFETLNNTRVDVAPEFQHNQNRIMAMGGEVNAPANVEGGEVFETPQGSMGQFKGANHEQGGMDMSLPEGTKIFSKRLKMLGKSMADRKKSREAKLAKASKALKNRPKDKLAQNSLERITELNQMEEAKDMEMQETLNGIDNLMNNGGVYRYGGKTYAYGGMTYANGGNVGDPVLDMFLKYGAQQARQAASVDPNMTVANLQTQFQDINNPNILGENLPMGMEGETVTPTAIDTPRTSETGLITGQDVEQSMDLEDFDTPDPLEGFSAGRTMIDFGKPAGIRNQFDNQGNIVTPPELGGFSAGRNLINFNQPTFNRNVVDDKGNISEIPKGFQDVEPINMMDQLGDNPALAPAIPITPTEKEGGGNFIEQMTGLLDKLTGKGDKGEGDSTRGGGLNLTKGDRLGMFGTKVGGFGPLATTLANRLGDSANVNWMRSFGRDALAANQGAKGRMQQILNSQLRNVQLREASARKRNAGQTRSLSTQRALNLASDQQSNIAEQQAQAQYAAQMAGLFGQQASLEQQQDQAVLGGEQQRDLADRQDRDNYFTNLSQNLTGMGSMYQAQGRNLNVAQRNKDLLAIMPELSQYGFGIEYGADGKPKLVQSKQLTKLD